MTEHQLDEVWKLAAEPVLCFDGDAAGQRAAGRALDRALPLLKAGRSLRFAVMPEGDDPDTLIRRMGPDAMREVLARAQPLVEKLWDLETAQPADTPERRAALEARLEARVQADRRPLGSGSLPALFQGPAVPGVSRPAARSGKRPAPAGTGSRAPALRGDSAADRPGFVAPPQCRSPAGFTDELSVFARRACRGHRRYPIPGPRT